MAQKTPERRRSKQLSGPGEATGAPSEIVQTAADAVRLHHQRLDHAVVSAAAFAARFPQFQPLAAPGATAPKAPDTPTARERVASLLRKAAKRPNVEAAKLESILFQHGDLEEVVSSLVKRELAVRQQLEKVKVIRSVIRLIDHHPDVFEPQIVEPAPHPFSRGIVEEQVQQLEPIAQVAGLDLRQTKEAPSPPPGEPPATTAMYDEHRRRIRERSEQAVRRYEAARAIQQLLADADWPFEDPEYPLRPHPLSRGTLDRLLESALQTSERAQADLREIQAERRNIGLNRGLTSDCQHKARVFLDLAAELMRYMAWAIAVDADNPYARAQAALVSSQEARESLRKPEIGEIAALACSLVNCAFPNVANISPESLRASRRV